MVAYAFTCESCGEFDVRRAMSDASAPAHCPVCGALARRLFSAPLTRRLPAARRTALDREDRSRHEPARAAEVSGRAMPHVHGAPGRPWMVGH